jgi:hypothetical protein
MAMALTQELLENSDDVRQTIFLSPEDHLRNEETLLHEASLLEQDEDTFLDAQATYFPGNVGIMLGAVTSTPQSHVVSRIQESGFASPNFHHPGCLKKTREDMDNERVARHLRMVTSLAERPTR